MANKNPAANRPRKGPSSAKSARGARPSAKGRQPSRGGRRWVGRVRTDWAVLALVGLTLALRLWGIHDRLPDSSLGINVLDDSAIEETDRTTMGRAWTLWRGGTKPLDLNPHTGGWPPLSFYLTFAIQYVYKLYYSLIQGGVTSQEFSNHVSTGSAPLFLFGRVVGALIGVLTVYLTYRIGARVLGRTAGLLAGLLLATNTLHILISQHVSDPNLMALLFVLLATLSMLNVTQGGTLRDSIRAGVMIGLAGACKYVPLVLAIPLTIAHRTVDRAKRSPLFRDRNLLAGISAIFLALFVASPFLFIDWKRTVTDIAGQRRALFSDWVGQTEFPISLPTYLARSLPHAMGWPAYALGLAGMVFLWRRGRLGRLLVWIPAVTVLANGMLKSPQERYVLVAIPFLHLGASLALVRGAEWLATRARERTAAGPAPAAVLAAPALAAILAVAWPLPELVAVRRSLSLPDSRHLARRWISENISPSDPIGLELYGPVFRDDERAMIMWPFFATQSPLARPVFHPEFLDGLKFYVASGEISRRFDAVAAEYPVETGYYRWLRARAPVVWRSDPKTTSGPQIEVRRLPEGISTRAKRDSVFAAAMPQPTRVNRVELWCLDLSKLFARLGEWERAEEWARRGLFIGVESMSPQLQAAMVQPLLRNGRPDSAEAYARLASAAVPTSPGLRLYHANALNELGRYEEALEEYREALTFSRGDPRIRLHIARTLSQLGRHEEALKQLEMVPPGHPDHGIALRDEGVLLLNPLRRPREALDKLRESIRVDPNQEGADMLRAQIAALEAAFARRQTGGAGTP